MVHDAISDEAATDLRASAPDFHPILAGWEVHSAVTKTLLREARQGVSGYKEKLDPDTFLALLDSPRSTTAISTRATTSDCGHTKMSKRLLYDWWQGRRPMHLRAAVPRLALLGKLEGEYRACGGCRG
jgi:hypothetical protein